MRDFVRLGFVALLLGALLGCGDETNRPPQGEDPCPEGFTECGGTCVDLLMHAENCGKCGNSCDGGVCVEGACHQVCPEEKIECEGSCVDPLSDAAHCGGCGKACADGEVCVGGSCVCGEGLEECDGACVDTDRDDANCGACGNACDGDRVCEEGSCACAPGTFECEGVCIGDSDENCGGCGIACGENQVCEEGECVLSCPAGTLACEGRCVDPLTDLQHCGECGTACFTGQSCVEGSCVCDGGLEACEGACVDTSTSVEHCGACGNSCFEGQICHEGECTCSGFTTECGGACVDTTRSIYHCGACDTPCLQRANAEPPSCTASACQFACLEDFDDCDGDEENGCEVSLLHAVQHCGDCGHDCTALANIENPGCLLGTCTYTCLPGFADCDGEDGCEASLSDLTSCGGCGNDCTQLTKVQTATCDEDGGSHACAIALCEDDWLNCNGNPMDGCEASAYSVNSCGGCGVSCPYACGSTGCTTAVAVHVGQNHNVCAILGDGSLWCWGENVDGRLDGGNIARHQPVRIPLPGPAKQVAAQLHFCAVLQDGTVACWGDNGFGQLGDGTTTSRTTPQLVPGLTDVKAVGVGTGHSCALTNQGDVYCWGDNSQLQLGVDASATPSSPTPIQVPGIPAVEKLAVGWSGACGVLADDTLRCWGGNAFGQLGNGSMPNPELPMDPGLTDIVSVSMGFMHTCGVFDSGDVKCWGWNQFGQLGVAPVIPVFWELTPVDVPNVGGAVEVVAGYGHSCAVLQNGDVMCWGSNYGGEIGDGNSLVFEVPPHTSASNATQVGAGWHLTCALKDTGRIECWGQNDRGQVGDGSGDPNLLVPSEVVFP